jgi:peptide deformylase
MAILSIIHAPDPRLKVKCTPVERVDDDVRKLMDDMLETMYDAPGIGLAAPQVGVHKRILVADVAKGEQPPAPMCLVNPRIVWASEETAVYEEGCLSLPEEYAEVTRPARVRIRHLDRDGAEHEITAEGLVATCLQHEMDHLDGILFVDHISRLKRSIILRRLQKAKQAEAKASA